MLIQIINGPNLNLIGVRQPEIYGTVTMQKVLDQLRAKFPQIEINYYQSNHEGDLIDKLHEVGFSADGIIINAGGYTHTSIALGDAVKSISSPVIEVQISDIYKREAIRQISYIKSGSIHQVIGKGVEGYGIAVNYFMTHAH